MRASPDSAGNLVVTSSEIWLLVLAISLQQDFDTHGQRSDARRLEIHTASAIVPVTTAFEAGRARYERVAQSIIATLRDANPGAPPLPLVE